MIKWIEATGKNEEAAIAAALSQLGLERDDVSVEVLDRAKSGFLGLGSTPARVKVSYEGPDEAPVKPAPPVKETPRAEGKEAPKAPPVKEGPKAEAPKAAPVSRPEAPKAPTEEAQGEAEPQDTEERAKAFLTGLMAQMGVEATPVMKPRAEGGFQVTLEGEKLGALIGHRGETLDAIQQLCNYAVNRGRTRRVRIHIDVENYRSKREEALQRLATKVAAKVVKYRRNVTLEPMNAYERHVIHEALQEYPDVLTYSTGTEPNRRTVVAYSRGKHTY